MIEFEIPEISGGNFIDFAVRRQFYSNLSKSKMANILYAIVATDSLLTRTYSYDCPKHTRGENAFNSCKFSIKINPQLIPFFEKIAKVKLEDMPRPMHIETENIPDD